MNAPPFNANPIIPVVIGSVLTICLRVSIYAHIWRYLSVYVHFMPILYREISVSVCLPVPEECKLTEKWTGNK